MDYSKGVKVNSVLVTSVIDGVKMVSTKDIANRTGKRHNNIMRDVKKQLEVQEIAALIFESGYLDANNQERPCFILNEEQFYILVAGYDIKTRSIIVKEWLAIKKAETPKLTMDMLIEGYQNEKALRIEAEDTKAWISNKKTATAMGTASVAVKKAKRLEIENAKLKEELSDSKVVSKATGYYYTPTELGEKIGETAIKFNLILEYNGYQTREYSSTWVATKLGEKFSYHRSYKGKIGTIVWQDNVLEEMGYKLQ